MLRRAQWSAFTLVVLAACDGAAIPPAGRDGGMDGQIIVSDGSVDGDVTLIFIDGAAPDGDARGDSRATLDGSRDGSRPMLGDASIGDAMRLGEGGTTCREGLEHDLGSYSASRPATVAITGDDFAFDVFVSNNNTLVRHRYDTTIGALVRGDEPIAPPPIIEEDGGGIMMEDASATPDEAGVEEQDAGEEIPDASDEDSFVPEPMGCDVGQSGYTDPTAVQTNEFALLSYIGLTAGSAVTRYRNYDDTSSTLAQCLANTTGRSRDVFAAPFGPVSVAVGWTETRTVLNDAGMLMSDDHLYYTIIDRTGERFAMPQPVGTTPVLAATVVGGAIDAAFVYLTLEGSVRRLWVAPIALDGTLSPAVIAVEGMTASTYFTGARVLGGTLLVWSYYEEGQSNLRTVYVSDTGPRGVEREITRLEEQGQTPQLLPTADPIGNLTLLYVGGDLRDWGIRMVQLTPDGALVGTERTMVRHVSRGNPVAFSAAVADGAIGVVHSELLDTTVSSKFTIARCN